MSADYKSVFTHDSIYAIARICYGNSVCLSSVSDVLYCGETVRPSEKVSEGVNRNQGQKVDFLGRRHISTSGFAATATAMATFALFKLLLQPGNRY